jgi:hypothetical protein
VELRLQTGIGTPLLKNSCWIFDTDRRRQQPAQKSNELVGGFSRETVFGGSVAVEETGLSEAG